jgi:hypothetical protein
MPQRKKRVNAPESNCGLISLYALCTKYVQRDLTRFTGGTMHIFKDEKETKRVIFNIDSGLALRLERARHRARKLSRKLNVDEAVDHALEALLTDGEHSVEPLALKKNAAPAAQGPIIMGPAAAEEDSRGDTSAVVLRKSMVPEQRNRQR